MNEALRVFRSAPTAKLPSKANFTDTGYDLFVNQECLVTEAPHAYPTGIKLLIPPGYWVKFLEKSGKALKGLKIHGGVIDNEYTGELKVIASAYPPLHLQAGEAICQFSLEQLTLMPLTEISEEEFLEGQEKSQRKDAGFGSTGR
jgi:dUTP pyrophosphatase